MSKPVGIAVAGAVVVAAALLVYLGFFRPSSSSSAGGQIEFTVQVEGNGSKLETWSDPSNHRRRTVEIRPGRPVETESVESGSDKQLTIYVIDFHHHSYRSQTIAIPGTTFDDPAVLAGTMRKQVTSGQFKIVGRGVFEGQKAIHLRRHETNADTPAAGLMPALTTDEWVEAGSYLPLRIQTVGGSADSLTTYRWLPPTGANLAKLQVVVPAGFTQLK